MFHPVNPNEVPSCADCGFLDECGGLEGDDFHRGCFQRCNVFCAIHGCDVVCPSTPLLFGEMFDDVGGICTPPKGIVPFDPSALPIYIPQINHGSQRPQHLAEPWVTVPLYAVASRDRRRRYNVRYSSAESLRAGLGLAAHTRIIITSVTPDQYIEDFWAEHKVKCIPEKLADLGIAAMTVPNFSFMRDVPRTNSLYNLTRIFRAAEAISAAGIPTILHINASTYRDWDRWARVLMDQSDISCVCVEFQTGTSEREIGERYMQGLITLQDRIGRSLHPLAVGGTARLAQLDGAFRSFTAVDSTPFMKTVKRQILYAANGFWKWRRRRTPPRHSLSARLARNIEFHRNRQLERIGRPPQTGDGQYLLN